MEKVKAECQTPQVSARKVAPLAGGGLGTALGSRLEAGGGGVCVGSWSLRT